MTKLWTWISEHEALRICVNIVILLTILATLVSVFLVIGTFSKVLALILCVGFGMLVLFNEKLNIPFIDMFFEWFNKYDDDFIYIFIPFCAIFVVLISPILGLLCLIDKVFDFVFEKYNKK